MTNREFYVNVLDLIDVIESDDPTGCVDTKAMGDKARELIAALDTRNEKRKSTESKEKKEVLARRESVLAFFKANPNEVFTRDAVAESIGLTPAQVTAACKPLILDNILVRSEVKADKGKRIVYSLAE